MPQMINLGKELLRIDPEKSNRLEVSRDNGRTWNTRHRYSSFDFEDLTIGNKGEILAVTSQGLKVSSDRGQTWRTRSRF